MKQQRAFLAIRHAPPGPQKKGEEEEKLIVRSLAPPRSNRPEAGDRSSAGHVIPSRPYSRKKKKKKRKERMGGQIDHGWIWVQQGSFAKSVSQVCMEP